MQLKNLSSEEEKNRQKQYTRKNFVKDDITGAGFAKYFSIKHGKDSAKKCSEYSIKNTFLIMKFGFKNKRHTNNDHDAHDDFRNVDFTFKNNGFQNGCKQRR